MSNRTIYMSIIAFAAAAAVTANTDAHAEVPGYATLSELIQEDLDAERQDFTLALTKRAGARINARLAERDNAFGPRMAFAGAPEAMIAFASDEF